MIRVALHHRTRYRYDRPVSLGPQLVRLRPAAHSRTPVASYALSILPDAHGLGWQQDPHGNWVARVTLPEPTAEFAVTVDLVADLVAINPFDFFVELYAASWPFAYAPALAADLAPFLAVEPAGPLFDALAQGFAGQTMPTVDLLIALNRAVNAAVGYVVRPETGTQAPEETLRLALGSCRDSGWLLVQLLRRLGIAARFVSGYAIQLAPDDPAEGGVEADTCDLHAWAEAYVPGAGWIGFDPTSGLLAGEGHIPLCATPHYRSATPIEGARYGEGEGSFDFAMTVRRIDDHHRPARPIADAAWDALEAAGRGLDGALAAAGLATGGEVGFADMAGGTATRALPPVAGWAALAAGVAALYDEAGRAGLSAVRYLADGRAAAAGPGTIHLRGPLPDALPGAVAAYWQRHPALSYLFAGEGIGRAGPAPRIDEALADGAGDLALALDHGGGAGVAALLGADGEIAVAAGGGLAFRGFAAAPHPRIALARHLLLRGIVLHLAREARPAPPVAWGSALRDRFLFGHHLWTDLLDVLGDLARGGLALDPAWFEADRRFRLPLHGRIVAGGVALEIAHALDPDARRGVARVEVRARGLVPGRHWIACQRRRLPLAPAGTEAGEGIAGVRYAAAADPLLPGVVPARRLTFDVLDAWNGRSLGGGVLHVGDPRGLEGAAPPVNAAAAEALWTARFEAGHSPGDLALPPPEADPAHPLTLDLRYAGPDAP